MPMHTDPTHDLQAMAQDRRARLRSTGART